MISRNLLSGAMQNGFDPAKIETLPINEQKMIERRQALLGSSYKLMYAHPVELVKGEGVYLYDRDGQDYLDCYNNVVSVGHCNAHVVEAITRQVATLNTHTRYMSETILDYSEQLLETFEAPLNRVMYTCSGSEANDLALRIAKFYTGGQGIIVTDYAYHGITTEIAAISPSLGQYVPLALDARTVKAPNLYRANAGTDIGQQFALEVEAAILDMQRHGIKFAGFLADSLFSTDGLLTGPVGFLKPVIDIVHQYGGLYIADEVQSGFARTGSHMWGYQRHGIAPDLVVMGKPMGNGMPIAAVVTHDQLLADFGKKVRYFNTFGGNPVCIAAAQAVLETIQQQHLMTNSLTIGHYITDGFKTIAKRYPQIGDVRGAGLYHAVELVKDPYTKAPDAALTAKIVNGLRERHVLLSTTGPYENCLKIRPLLIFEKQHADRLLTQFEATLQALVG